METLLIAGADGLDEETLERQLFIIRKLASHQIRGGNIWGWSSTAAPVVKVMIYRGCSPPSGVAYYPDWPMTTTSHLAMGTTSIIRSRWDRAAAAVHGHNGEINTLRSNWMFARQGREKRLVRR
jgi:glutamate synthase (NADPH/NADH) large chain